MARRDALVRLQKTLIARRDELRKLLQGELAIMQDSKAADSSDVGDLAFAAYSDEMSSRLAEMDARELEQIERVLARLKQGSYGVCAGGGADCQRRIPVARLNAVPYAMYCINCERKREQSSYDEDHETTGNWAQVFAFQAPKDDRRLDLSKLEMGLPSSRRG